MRVGHSTGRDQHRRIDNRVAGEDLGQSAAEVPGEVAPMAPNAANSSVESSDTRNTAVLEIQKIVHGDAVCAATVPVLARVAERVIA
jgi:hypothetical protein